MLEELILGMVVNDDLTGYDIKKLIENNIGVFCKASFGSIYPALKRLSAGGALTQYEQPVGNRQKTFYHITDEGRKRFFNWLSEPMQVLDGTNPNLAKIYFFDTLPDDVRSMQLTAYELNNLAYLHKLEALEKKFSETNAESCHYYKLSTLYYGICVVRQTIEWCRHVKSKKPLKELTQHGRED